MFRFTKQFTQHLRSNPISYQKIGPTTCSLFNRTDIHISDPESFIRLADEFANEGNIGTAEDIYKKIIKHNPQYKKAYDRLWGSWLTNCLKVPEQELEDFMSRYQKYIDPNISYHSTVPKLK
jgi:hypothetical protein